MHQTNCTHTPQLFSLTSPEERHVSGLRYTLPITFLSFLDERHLEMWTTLFENGFDARRRFQSFDDLFISGPHPLSNIFYLLQSIAPGMLLVVRAKHIDQVGQTEYVRALPSESWVNDHGDVLMSVLGGIEEYHSLLRATTDDGKLCSETCDSRWVDSSSLGLDDGFISDDDARYEWDSDWNPDYTACGSDCGYCGHCEYP